MTRSDFPPLHPGEVLLEEFLKPMALSQHQLALMMRVAPQKINDIVHGKRALRLARVLGTTPEFWMGLQSQYDLETVQEALGSRLQKEVTPLLAENKPDYSA
jgi:addiction module HigA family antidote